MPGRGCGWFSPGPYDKETIMKFFGRKSAGREPPRPVLSRGLFAFPSFGGGAPSPGDWPRGYEAQVRDGYIGNPVAQRAVRLVSEGVGSAPVAASDRRAAALVAATSAGQSLLEIMALHLLLHGNAFVQVLPDADGHPRELFALRPERVTVEADARGWPAAYLYKAGAAVTRLSAEDARGHPAVIHVKAAHPIDDHYGLGCLGAAAGAIAIHNAATQWNKALLDNAARPSGALVYDTGEAGAVLAADQFDRLRSELDTSFSGAGNAGRPMLLEGGLKWQALSLSPADMDFAGMKAAAAREIALAFGVPPMLLGLPAAGCATCACRSRSMRLPVPRRKCWRGRRGRSHARCARRSWRWSSSPKAHRPAPIPGWVRSLREHSCQFLCAVGAEECSCPIGSRPPPLSRRRRG